MAKRPKDTPQMPRPARGDDRFFWDEEVPGLARRERAGLARWVVQRRGADNKRRRVTLGDCRKIPLALARQLARAELDATSSTPPSGPAKLAPFAEQFLADCAGRWKPSTLRANAGALHRQILPSLGDRALERIDQGDVAAWMRTLECGEGTKNRALSVLSSLFQHAELLGLIPPGTNPCKGLRRRQSTFKGRYLGQAEYAALGRAFAALEEDAPLEDAALRFIALTGCRKGEALALEWSMIDGNRAALPDAKSGPKAIWLGRAARRVLAGLPRGSGFVFGGDAPMGAHSETS